MNDESRKSNQQFLEPWQVSSCQLTKDTKKRVSFLCKIKRKIIEHRSGCREDKTGDSSIANSAQEILSPRELIGSMTNKNFEIDWGTFQEVLKNLIDMLMVIGEQEDSLSPRISHTDIPVLGRLFIYESCKLKSNSDLSDGSRLMRIREYDRPPRNFYNP